MKSSVITDQANVVAGALAVAGMLEEQNKTYGTQILISNHTFRRSSVQQKVLARLVDYCSVEESEEASQS